MGTYASIRGWIELDVSQRQRAEQIIQTHDDGFYSGGWGWPNKPFNWTLYLFYGGDVRVASVPEIREQVERLAQIMPREEGDEMTPRGFFLVTDELGHTETWHIEDGAVVSHPTTELRWLES
ncbi:hypothetical protein [Actinomadura harenae]|uniref:Uncharacterized protein n=1 Tax=Actinomadura harenae TaxID=2483351 RepID=A0A3M2LVS4_9ACTN|nr:hypothetical protein [Actinomadura harenae]RMI41000.1 hypothetical protein EBO15_24655 [Actinomadura harenae]